MEFFMLVNYIPEVKKAIFHAPATVVYWEDGTNTVVKCGEGDTYDPEKGLAMAFCKRVLGNKGNYYEMFKDALPEEYLEEAAEHVEAKAEEPIEAAEHVEAGAVEHVEAGADKE